jgi:hypothetical protein
LDFLLVFLPLGSRKKAGGFDQIVARSTPVRQLLKNRRREFSATMLANALGMPCSSPKLKANVSGRQAGLGKIPAGGFWNYARTGVERANGLSKLPSFLPRAEREEN